MAKADKVHLASELPAARRAAADRAGSGGAAAQAFGRSPRLAQQDAQLGALFGPAVQRQGAEEEELLQGRFRSVQRVEDEELLQGRFENRTPAQRVQDEELMQGRFAAAPLQREADAAAASNQTGMPDNLKAGIESLSGLPMDGVRVHYNSAQPAQLNALAYAQGSDIHLAPGQEQHLPHEAWHVVQQAQGRVAPTMQLEQGVPVNDDAGLEHEADVMGDKAAGGVSMG